MPKNSQGFSPIILVVIVASIAIVAYVAYAKFVTIPQEKADREHTTITQHDIKPTNTDKPSPTIASNMLNWENSDLGVSLQYPNTWLVSHELEGVDETSVFRVTPSRTNKGNLPATLDVNVYKDYASTVSELEAKKRSAVNETKYGGNFRDLTIEQIKVGNYQGIKARYIGNFKLKNVKEPLPDTKYTIKMILKGTDTISFSVQCDPDSLKECDEAEQILDSVQFN